MFKKYWKNETPLDLISVHIPKCAGTSFRLMLIEIFGEDKLARVDIPLGGSEVRINEALYNLTKIPKGIRVVHGHFNPVDLKAYFGIPDETPCITWLRHPVDRVISNYYYLDHILRINLEEEKKGLNILAKMERTLLEYARAKKNRNRISKFMRGSELENFNFIGIFEDFDAEADRLRRIMRWKSVAVLKVNQTPTAKREVTEKIRSRIADWNIEDMRLYEEALNLKEKRLL